VNPTPDISILILTRNEAPNLARLLPALAQATAALGRVEVVVVDAQSPDGTAAVASSLGARVLSQAEAGYANALRQGLADCRGEWIVALDADLSHGPEVVAALLQAASAADLVIASRYVPGGRADMPLSRRLLSLALNRVFAVALGLPLRDLSSGFRVYRRAALAALQPQGEHFDVLPELAALAHFRGLRVRELPFHYRQRDAGVSKARVLHFAPAYLRTLLRCWRAKRGRAA
jgi:dolichol-phosphate mannosyltransferase